MNAEIVSGETIHQIVEERDLHSIRERSCNLLALTAIQRLIFVGSTCVGKSTLERALRTASINDPLLKGKISVPSRVITRLPRSDDKDAYFCTIEEFSQMIRDQALGLYGIKIMEQAREEPYGYLKPQEETLPIFFTNNQTLKNRASVRPEGVLDNALIVVIYTPDDIREQRLRQRSAELFIERPQETAFRLSKEERAIGLAPEAHLIFKNYGRFANRSALDLLCLVRGIIDLQK